MDKILDAIKQQIVAYCEQQHDFQFNPQQPSIKLHEPTFGAEEIFAAVETLLSTQVTMGKKVAAFEKEYSEHFQYGHSVMNNSGSSANLLAIAALTNPVTEGRLMPGDEVIVPALSWSTTVWPLIQCQLVPVFVDCELATLNMDIQQIEAAITPKTRAIMPVHVYGNPCDMDGIMSLAKKYDLLVVEDCCESMGAYYDGKAVGSFGAVGTFSYYFSHHITTLEGGMCVTGDPKLAELMRILRAHGWSREVESHDTIAKAHPHIDPRFIFVNVGYNLRVTELQGAFGLCQLPKLDGILAQRKKVAQWLQEKLSQYQGYFDFQETTAKSDHAWFGFCMVVKEDAPFKRETLTEFLKKNHIENRPIIAGNLSVHPALAHYEHRVQGELSNANRVMDHGLALGCHHAMDEAACDYIAEVFEQFMKENQIGK